MSCSPPAPDRWPPRLVADVRVQLLRVDAKPLRDVLLAWKSTSRSLGAWMSDDGRALQRDIDRMIAEIGARIVDEVLRSPSVR